MRRERRHLRLDALDHALRQFVGAVAAEVRIVGERLVLAGKTIRGKMHEGLLRRFRPERFVEGNAHRVEIDHRHVQLRADLADRLRITLE